MVKCPRESDDPKLSPQDADIIVKLSVLIRSGKQCGNYAISSERIIVNGLGLAALPWPFEL